MTDPTHIRSPSHPPVPPAIELTDANHLSAKNAAVIPDMVSVTKGRVDIIYDDTNTPQQVVENPGLPRIDADTSAQTPQPAPTRHIIPVKRPLYVSTHPLIFRILMLWSSFQAVP